LPSEAAVADPGVEPGRQRVILTGDVPSPTVERKGCAFVGRCVQRMPGCSEEAPRLKPVWRDHETARFLDET